MSGHLYHNPRQYDLDQYREEEGTMPSEMMMKGFGHQGGSADADAGLPPPDFLAAPKRKREDSIDEISASRQQDESEEDEDDDFVFPLHKRSVSLSSSRALPSFSLSSYDNERREGPAEDDEAPRPRDDDEEDESDEELAKKFRSSIFRHPDPPSPASTSASSGCVASPRRPFSPFSHKRREEEESEDEADFYSDFPAIGRATTICEDSSACDLSCLDPPDMSSGPASPVDEELIELEPRRGRRCRDLDDWRRPPTTLAFGYGTRGEGDEEEDPILEARKRPEWLQPPSTPVSPSSASSSPSASVGGPAQLSPLWSSRSPGKGSFWPPTCSSDGVGWTGMFHQGSA